MRRSCLSLCLRSVRIALVGVLLATRSDLGIATPKGDQRRLWAYPTGVIVTSDGGAVWQPKTDEDARTKDGASPQPTDLGATANDVTALVKALEKRLTDCLSTLRSATPDLAASGAQYSFTLEVAIASDGTAHDAVLTKRGSGPDLPPCTETARSQLASHRFVPHAGGQVATARAAFDALIMTDDEAKGRGFQYFEAETAWERVTKASPAWFACTKAADCVVTTDMCDVRGVNAADVAAYRLAAQNRKKPGCTQIQDPEDYTATCHRGTCAARPK